MNQCEMMFEIEMTPNRFREIAAELERIAKSDLFIKGQVIRYKFNHKFAFIYRPEIRAQIRVTDTKESCIQDVLNEASVCLDQPREPLNSMTPPQ